MYNSFYHSAEGSHWTKKNHKYIRKEGNRYIYPEDIKGQSLSRPNSSNAYANQTHLANRRSALNNQSSMDYRQASDAHRMAMNRANAANGGGARDYRALNEQRSNRQMAKNGKVINPTYRLETMEGKSLGRIKSHDKVSMPGVSDYKNYSRDVAQANNRAKAKNGTGARNQEYAKAANVRQKALRDRAQEVAELKRMDARDSQRSADYKQLSADKAKASASKKINTANSSQEYAKSLSQKNRQKLNRTSAANGSTTDYKALSYQHRQNDPETKNRADERYKTLQKQAANRKKAANGDYVNYKEASYEHRKNDPKLKTRQDSHYKGLVNRQNRQAENRAKAANGKTVDYKELSKQHADNDELIQRNKKRHAQEEMFKEGKRKDATRNQATPDYKYMSELNKAKTESTPEAQKAKRKKHKKENRREFGKNVVNKLMKYNKAMFLGGNTSKNTADRYIHNENSKKSKHH